MKDLLLKTIAAVLPVEMCTLQKSIIDKQALGH